MELARLRTILTRCCSIIESECRLPLQKIRLEVPNDLKSLNKKWDRTAQAIHPQKIKALSEYGYEPTSDGLHRFNIDMFQCIKDHQPREETIRLPDPTAFAACIVFQKEKLEPLSQEVMRRVLTRYLIGLEEYDEVAEEVKEMMPSARVEARIEELKGRLVPLAIDSLKPEDLGNVDGWLRFSVSMTHYAITGDLELMQRLRDKLVEIYSLVED